MQIPNPLSNLIEQAGRLQGRRTGFHEKFIPVFLYGVCAAKPIRNGLAAFFNKVCIVKAWVYQPGFAVYIALGFKNSSEMSELLNELQALETELHHSHARGSASRLEQLLHSDFQEVGCSGCTYDRSEAMQHLLKQSEQSEQSEQLDIKSWAFATSVIGPHAILLTYRSAQQQMDGTLSHHAHRSSIWLKGPHGWQVFFHQGTPTKP